MLWKTGTNSGITAVPSAFAVDGKQYIAVQSGWRVDVKRMQDKLDAVYGTKTDVPQGDVLWVFALSE
jgi:alcohol dehydrogenase (cytochrome c)